MKAVVAAFNQEKALVVGAFSVITNLRMEVFEALLPRHPGPGDAGCVPAPRPPPEPAAAAARHRARLHHPGAEECRVLLHVQVGDTSYMSGDRDDILFMPS